MSLILACKLHYGTQMEIDERSYLLSHILTHISHTYKIKIHSLIPFSPDGTNYWIQCNFHKENASGKFVGELLTENLNDVLYYYLYS
jgi:hypothetical protein